MNTDIINDDNAVRNEARIQISGDTIRQAMNGLIALGEITEEEAGHILWTYAWAQTNNLSMSNTARAIGIDPSTLGRLFSATYSAGYSNVVAKLAKFRKLTEARSSRKNIGFIETSVWRKIDAVCTNALHEQMPAFIYGPSQIGKTTCLQEFARRNNHGTTKYFRMPAACTFGYFVRSLASACFLGTLHTVQKYSLDRLRDRICDSIDHKNLLIIDEFHQAMVTCQPYTAGKIVEFIREVYDRTHCGVVLSATKVGERELEQGVNAGLYDQLRRRGMVKLVLPDTATLPDVKKIASHFELEPPEGEVLEAIRQMLKTSGTGMYIKYLQAAHSMSAKKEQPLTWSAFAQVYNGMLELAKGH